jgi:GTP-binding protein HflX
VEFFERHQGGEKAILVHLELRQYSQDEDLSEFQLLALSAGSSNFNRCHGNTPKT